MDRRSHWERAYRSRDPDRVGWFRPRLDTSLRLIADCDLSADAPLVDVGGGASTLVDHLLGDGYTRATILDLSLTALRIARTRLADNAARAGWVVADVLSVPLAPGSLALWHDRAVYHFLVDRADRDRYRDQLLATLGPDGQAILGAFTPEAPERCSGLPVRRTTPEQLQAELGPALRLVDVHREAHTTPGGVDQPYVYCRFARTD